MWGWSDAAVATLRGEHTPVTRIDILHSGKPVYSFPVVTGGSVRCDEDAVVRWSLEGLSIVDETGAFSRGDVEDDLLIPHECEIVPWRGVRIGTTTTTSTLVANAGWGLQPWGTSGWGGVESTSASVTTYRSELAPLGVFGLTGREVSDGPDGLAIQLTGQDRAVGYQGPMDSALAINGGTPVETAIARLLVTRNPGLALSAMATGFTCGPLVYEPDIDVWAAAQELAEAGGGRLFHDRTGLLVFEPAGPASDRPVAVYAEGDGLLLTVNRSEDSDTINNVVVAETPDGSIRAVAEDTDPNSPTYARGRYGRRVFTLVNQHFSTTTQAQLAATARLAYELGRSETVTFTAVPDPGVDVDEVVTVHRPRAGLDNRGVVVASVEVPLAVTDPMQVGCRQSRLARDGRVVEAPELP